MTKRILMTIALLALTSHVVKHSHTPDRLSGRENG